AKDPDPGVRSRAATVLGECGTIPALRSLWRRVLAAEDGRVQDKAWQALVEIVVRAGRVELLQEWDNLLLDEKQSNRRLALLSEVSRRWNKHEETKSQAAYIQPMLVEAQLEQGKWTAALPLVREALTRSGGDAEVERRLRWLL